jgi:uncharacterized small protein (DUF1192 family)
MSRDRAAYMREYRKRRRRETVMNTTMPAQAVRELIDAQDRIRDLEAEVARLKRELALRPAGPAFNSRPFRPVPQDGPLGHRPERRHPPASP